MKKFAAIFISAVMAVTMSSCSIAKMLGKIGADQVNMYITGSLDVMYKDTYNDDFLDFTDMTSADADKIYNDGINTEVEYFIQYFGFYDNQISDNARNAIADMYKQLYKNAKYEIVSIAKNGENYSVKLSIEPINVITAFVEQDYETFESNMVERIQNENLSMENAFDFDFIIDDMIGLILSRAGENMYNEAQTLLVEVAVEDGFMSISDNDIVNIDNLVIAY